jgi:hypothetical protein
VISTYPFGAFHSATDIPDDYYTPLLARTSKPLAVAEGGFSSIPMEPFGGSDADQIAYITRIHDQLGPRLAFWIYIIINDLDMDSYAPNMKKDQDTLTWFTRMGFFDVDENPKPALEVWDSFRNSPYAVTIKQPLFDRNMWARSENLAKTATYLLRRVRNIS